MTVEAQRKVDTTLVKVPSTNSIPGEKDDESSDDYYSFSDSPDDLPSERSWSSLYSQDVTPPKFSLAVAFVKRLHGSVVQKKGETELDDITWEDGFLCNNDLTFPNDPTGELPNSWGTAEPSLFQIRGDTFLVDRKKVMGKSTLMQLVAANCLRSQKRQGDLAGRPGSIVQKFAAAGNPDFFFIINMQIPAASTSTTYNIAFYYTTTTPLKDIPLLHKFVEGDDAYRNSRFKLIPHVSKGPWLVKQSVGSRACLLGQILNIKYVRGINYLELDIDVSSSRIAKRVASTVLGSFNNLIVETAFLIQGNTKEELPEHLIGTCRLNHLDISKATWA